MISFDIKAGCKKVWQKSNRIRIISFYTFSALDILNTDFMQKLLNGLFRKEVRV